MTASPERDLQATLEKFVLAPGWPETRWILATHSELLTDEADSLLSRMKVSAREMGMNADAEVADTHQRLLRLSRQIGAKAAFTQVVGRDFPPLPPKLFQLCESAAVAGNAAAQSGNKKQLLEATQTLEAGLGEHAAELDHAPLEAVDWVVSIAINLRFQSFIATKNPDDLMAAVTYWDHLLEVASGSVYNLSAYAAGVAGGLLIAAHLAGLGTLPAAVEALEYAVTAGEPGPEREAAAGNLKYARSLAAKG